LRDWYVKEQTQKNAIRVQKCEIRCETWQELSWMDTNSSLELLFACWQRRNAQ